MFSSPSLCSHYVCVCSLSGCVAAIHPVSQLCGHCIYCIFFVNISIYKKFWFSTKQIYYSIYKYALSEICQFMQVHKRLSALPYLIITTKQRCTCEVQREEQKYIIVWLLIHCIVDTVCKTCMYYTCPK